MFKLKKISIILLYFLAIIYAVEILLYLFLSNEQRSLINIKEKRIEIAKKKNVKFDIRTGLEVYISENKKNENLYIPFYFNKTYAQLKSVKKNLDNQILVPFRGPINKQTLSCAEDLNYKIINNDKYGFKNPNSIYEKNIDLFLIGDSYTEGLCENEKNDTAGHLRSLGFNSINFGITGAGPLTSLAVLREYLTNFKPKFVVYQYFEGNDLKDLNWEKNTFLKKYLKSNFSLNYLDNQKKIQTFLENFQRERHFEITNHEISKSTDNGKNIFISSLKDILEITNIKGILRSNLLVKDENIDMDLFFLILDLINKEVKNNQSELIFVYIPSWSRYFTKFNEDKILFEKKKEIIDYVSNKNIKFIDFDKILNMTENKKSFFPLGYIGHFNSKGYLLIANSIENIIN